MSRFSMFVAAGALSLAVAGAAQAQGDKTATQTVTYEVQGINELSVSGNPGALTVSVATAGSQPTAATNATTTYSFTTNLAGGKITAEIDTDMPAGLTLTANLQTPGGAASTAGAVTLSSVAVDAVTGIDKQVASAKTITYSLTANVSAGVVASATKTVTLTLVAGT